jgi:uncharacterized protein (TIGR02145 family)
VNYKREKKKALLIAVIFLTIKIHLAAQVTGTYTDTRDGKIYKTVTIGTQTWMAENLAYQTGKGCWAYQDDTSYVKTYGYLYDWETAIMACPNGWHLPNKEDWLILTDFLGGKNIAGGKLKEIGTKHWLKLNIGATDSYGFAALPGGNRYNYGKCFDMRLYGRWWSASVTNNNSALCFYLYFENSNIKWSSSNMTNGFSVRCIKN